MSKLIILLVNIIFLSQIIVAYNRPLIYCTKDMKGKALALSSYAKTKSLDILVVSRDSFSYEEMTDSLISWKKSKTPSVFLVNNISKDISASSGSYRLKVSPNPIIQHGGGEISYNINDPEIVNKKVTMKIVNSKSTTIHNIIINSDMGFNTSPFHHFSSMPVGKYTLFLYIDGVEADKTDFYITTKNK